MRSGSNEEKIIEVQDLAVKYPSRDRYSIKDISFSIRKGDFLWLAGDSASGKSTLMNCLCGFIPHIIPAEVEGDIIFEGKKNLDSMELAKDIGMVHQDPEAQFCTERVEDEIAFGLENFQVPTETIDAKIEDTLEQLNCSDLRYRELRTLSGGEKQKIAIASMLVLNPDVLILDEPTANLDSVSMQEVLDAVKQVREENEDLTLIIAEHRVSGLIDHIDRVLKLKDGRIYLDVDDFQTLDTEGRERLIDYSYPEYKRGKGKKERSVVTIEGLSYSVDDNRILKSVSAEVREGDIIALMGRNGSGKTTLIKHISGLIDVQEGRIQVLGSVLKERGKASPWEMGKNVGLVFQNPNHQIFENSIEKEMMFGPENFDRGRTRAREKLQGFIEDEGVEKRTHPHTLSFGQKRRLNIHSSTGHEPELLIIDEPFSGQDHNNALAIAELLNRYWMGGKTLLIVTHNLEFAKRFCTRAWVMKDGELIYDGSPQRLKNIEGDIEDEG